MTGRSSRLEAVGTGRAPLVEVLARIAPTAALAVALVALVTAGGTSPLFTRPLWLDEIHTWLIAGAPTMARGLRDLAAGSDFNPPTLYLLYRLVALLPGPFSEIPMRLAATASVVVAVVAVYRLVREDCGRSAAAAAALALFSHSTVMAAAFDARFYGPWLAGVAFLVLTVRRVVAGRSRWFDAVLLAMVSAFVCTIHYFGVASWCIAVAAGALVAERPGLSARRLMPAVAGPVALVLCIPLYLSQRATLSVPTWNPPASIIEHAFLLAATLIPLVLIPPLIAWAASAALRREQLSNVARRWSIGPGTTLLLAQAMVPFILVSFSLVVQPATQPRYWITGTLAVSGLVAVAMSRSTLLMRAIGFVGMGLTALSGVRDEIARAQRFDDRVREDARYAERAREENMRLVVRRRHTLYPLLRGDGRWSNVAVLFDAPSNGADSLLVRVDREVAHIHQRLYGFPRMVDAQTLAAERSFLFLEYDSTRTPTSDEFPQRTIEPVGRRLFRVR